MTSRQTLQYKQQIATGLLGCVAVAMHSWTPTANISNLFERGYDPRKRVLEEKSI